MAAGRHGPSDGDAQYFLRLMGAKCAGRFATGEVFSYWEKTLGRAILFSTLLLLRWKMIAYDAALRPSLGMGTSTPSSVYCFNLLRSVRMEMPKMFAACVRLPRQ